MNFSWNFGRDEAGQFLRRVILLFLFISAALAIVPRPGDSEGEQLVQVLNELTALKNRLVPIYPEFDRQVQLFGVG